MQDFSRPATAVLLFAGETMIYLHKILPMFFLPTGITLLLLMAGVLLRRRALCWAGIVVLWLPSTPLISDALTRAAEGWQVRERVSTMPEAHAIVVLSSGRLQPPGDSSITEWGDADRFYGGIDLYRAEKAPLLIFTGGWLPWQPNVRPEGEVLVDYALDLGVPRDRILTTGKVSNTDEESRAIAKLLADQYPPGVTRRVLLVTSAIHMRRAQLLFSRAGIESFAFPVDFRIPADQLLTPLRFIPNGGALSRAETALRELYGLCYYRFVRS
jgi:uncharacterized SAM-binding protein YcdF (DUF218 family)